MMRRILSVSVKTELDVLAARQRSRQITALCGFTSHDQVRISTVVSELARNIYNYADSGRIDFSISQQSDVQSLMIRIEDLGPGIAHLPLILAGRYHSETGMGLGILGARRMMDECDITTVPNEGTTIVLKKLLPAGAAYLTPAMIGDIGSQIGTLQVNVALSEMQQQNKDLLEGFAALKAHQDKLLQLTQELQTTNEKMVALNVELAVKAEQLQRADVRKDEFLAILAHELRTPLAAAAMTADVLENVPVSQARVIELGKTISRQVGHMSRLVEDLLDVSRVTRGLVAIKNDPVDMRAVVLASLEQTSPLVKSKSHSLLQSLPDVACHVSGDMTRLVQVVSNLLTNAARYTPAGGRITVDLAADEDWIVVEVMDNGVGIDPELMPRLFDLYVQAEVSTDARTGGLGLGLSLVKSIVDLHRGTVSAASEGNGKGSRFRVQLPRIQ
ncbi:MAG TPA: ATP-binding protein [Noviherbaspirillum sp.]|jgi:signal transduction histidine kinase|uniref:ATP-binding protein n=1 Tax=Noviherbaspirillum sp. TaxID=1926288 RepID=UPI002DDCEFB6|nr:ATP-binding protein [Noviherbaspirillum sp.]HEV2610026.1 ATP-binding protein [Noviherbaspirillum sp.]